MNVDDTYNTDCRSTGRLITMNAIFFIFATNAQPKNRMIIIITIFVIIIIIKLPPGNYSSGKITCKY